jgi:poly(A) polymerase
MTVTILRRLMMAERDVAAVAKLVKNHMRLGSASTFSPSAARRLIRDMGDQLEDLLRLVEADANGLRPGVRVLDLHDIRARIEEVQRITPRTALESPLSGEEIMATLGLDPGRRVGELKAWLTEQVLEGGLAPDDQEAAKAMLRQLGR